MHHADDNDDESWLTGAAAVAEAAAADAEGGLDGADLGSMDACQLRRAGGAGPTGAAPPPPSRIGSLPAAVPTDNFKVRGEGRGCRPATRASWLRRKSRLFSACRIAG
jgi:hypothetical protein